MTRLPDGASEAAAADYGRSLIAFQATLFETDGTFGGVPISYTITDESYGFGMHIAVYRGPIAEGEVGPPGMWTTLRFQDATQGGYICSIWGSENASAIYYPNGKLGFLSSDAENASFEYNKLSPIDGYDFEHCALKIGAGMGISTWDNWSAAAAKGHSFIRDGNSDRASGMLDKLRTAIIHQMQARNSDINVEFDLLSQIIDINGQIEVNFEQVNRIIAYVNLRLAFANNFEGMDDTKKYGMECNFWNNLVRGLKFAVGKQKK